jgi:hypothetical protein
LYSRRTNNQFQEAFGIDSNNDIVFNRNSIVAGIDSDAPKAPSALIFGTGAGKFLDVRSSSNSTLLRVDEATGNVSIGGTAPAAKLHIKGAEEGIRIQGLATGNPNQAYLSFVDIAGTRIGYVGDGSTGDKNVFLNSDLGDVVLNTAAGRVLTATSSGDVKLGSSGQLFATGGEESLRIIRGVISATGGIIAGSGFQVTRNGTPGASPVDYHITFDTAFSGAPTVVATTHFGTVAIAHC